MAYQTTPQSGKGFIVIDIKASAIQEFLDSLDMGEGSIIGFVTKSGREIISENFRKVRRVPERMVRQYSMDRISLIILKTSRRPKRSA